MIDMISFSWSDFINTVNNKELKIQYYETSNKYELYAIDYGAFMWRYSLLKDGGADVSDWENNYKNNANQSLGLFKKKYSQSTVTEASLSSSGSTSVMDTDGLACLSFTADVTAISGVGASIMFALEASDDGINWNHVHSTRRITDTGAQRLSGVRLTARYYRYSWEILGITPSININISTTLKDYLPIRTGSLFKYDDIDLKISNSVSTYYNAFSNTEVGCMIVRPTDTSSSAIIRIQASNDSINWHDHTGDITIDSNQTINRNFTGDSHRFYRVIVTSPATGGTTSTCHFFWNSTGGA